VVEFKPDSVAADLGRRRFNIAPAQNAPILIVRGAERVLADSRWGLIPPWADDPSVGNRMINARAESAAVKPSFREALHRHRCLVPADGFYEWQETNAGRQPLYIRAPDSALFAFAGLYSTWSRAGIGTILSHTIITTAADEFMRPVHDRMPVILPAGQWSSWIDPKQSDEGALQQILMGLPDKPMRMIKVSRAVNSPANDDERCIVEMP